MSNEELVKLFQEGHDPQGCLEKLYFQNMGLIRKICMKYGRGEEQADLEQECFFAIETAARMYDTRSEASFATYAVFWLKQRVIRYRQDNGSTVRVAVAQRQRIADYHKAVNSFRVMHGRDPKKEELCEVLQLSPDQIEDLRQHIEISNALSLNASVGEDGETEVADLVPGPGDLEEEATDRVLHEELREEIDKCLRTLTEREEAVIRAKYYQGQTQTEIGERLGVSSQQVHQDQARAMRKLRSKKSLMKFADVYGLGIRHTAFSVFQRTGTSSTEFAAMKLYDIQRAREKILEGLGDI